LTKASVFFSLPGKKFRWTDKFLLEGEEHGRAGNRNAEFGMDDRYIFSLMVVFAAISEESG
jgi:hypothetical protein